MSKANYRVPQPQRLRRITTSFAWIDHRLVRNGYLGVMTHQDQGLYLFLALAADRHGVSFYRKEKICDLLGLDFGAFEVARDRLIALGLLAFAPYSALSVNGFYQLLPIDGPAPDFAAMAPTPPAPAWAAVPTAATGAGPSIADMAAQLASVFRRSLLPDDLGMTCRQLSRLLYALVRQRARLKQLIGCKLDWLWPEFEGQLSDPLGVTGRAVLRAACTPAELLVLPEPALVELIEKASRKKLGAELAQRLRSCARTSVGMRRGSQGAALAIRTLLDALDAARPIRRELERQIVALSNRLPRYLLTLPGVTNSGPSPSGARPARSVP